MFCFNCLECGRCEEAAFSIEFCSEICRDKWMGSLPEDESDIPVAVPVDDWETHDLELALDGY